MHFLAPKIIAAMLLISFLLGGAALPNPAGDTALDVLPPDISAASAILIDADTGEILFEKAAAKRYAPENLSMLMTGLLAAEWLNADDELVMDYEVYRVSGQQINIQTGERLTADDLLYSMMLYAAGDSAVGLGKGVSGTTADFVNLMNARARLLECTSTEFTSPQGQPSDDYATTASDLAKIAQAVMENARLQKVLSRSVYKIPATNAARERILESLWIDSPLKVIMATHEETENPGLVATAEKDGHRLIAVLLDSVVIEEEPALGAPYKDGDIPFVDDASLLFDYGFALAEPAEPELAGDAALGVAPEEDVPAEVAPPRRSFLEAIGLSDFKPEGFSFYVKLGAAIIILLVIILLIVLIRHRYRRDPYVRSVRYGRATREIKRIRKLR